MALYEFKCERCGNKFETILAGRDPEKFANVKCPKCESRDVKKLVSLAGAIREFFCAPSG